MNMYEIILSYLDQAGHASIPSICQQVNNNPLFMKERKKPVRHTHIKSVISRKKDLFYVHNDMVSLLPERNLVSLTANIEKCGSPWFQVKVDFNYRHFIFFEMNLDPCEKLQYRPVVSGSTNEFKQEIYRLNIWDWEPNYDKAGIVLDGTSWSVKLETRSKTYKSEGLQCFPKEWTKFCCALTKLTGKNIIY
ncbi:hypothetical protein [Niallia endozanthoxylica]|uniref:Uncharacterized protein n=1 Tax=Niallia endozanthoxylica TaxID=2036016 RepID=A0A5J5HTA4_9BACI|nr:hypothetical protein [Niallia endozanthoxylica]KAA9025756.1 hypothetical protein F4V44_07660 [Niallia endozanthoxylica]